jgi:hypothetical protein
MVQVSAAAKALIEKCMAASPNRRWYLAVFWEKGGADNRRTSDGAVAWQHEPAKGWRLQLMDYDPTIPDNLGEPLLPGLNLAVAANIGRPFPGGVIDVEGSDFVLREHAV